MALAHFVDFFLSGENKNILYAGGCFLEPVVCGQIIIL